MALKTVFRVLGILLSALAAAMLFPAAVSFSSDSYEYLPFLLSALITGFIGGLMTLANPQLKAAILGIREAFILTVLSWIFIAAFASLPFILSEEHLSITDACFEATSALTTTGATVIRKLDQASAGIVLWRAILQWLGGIGIIVMALTILPVLKIGGMQLFRLESSDRTDRILPRVSQTATNILIIQLVFTIFFAIALWSAGMTFLEAVCHAMSALSTGGLSTADDSIEHFQSPTIEIILIFAMLIGGCSMLLLIRALQGSWKEFFSDRQLRGFLGLTAIASLVLTFWRCRFGFQGFGEVLCESTFTVVSLITTTGFTSGDYTKWGNFAVILLFLLSFVGGCTGSTTGGLKIFRLQVLLSIIKTQIAHLRYPHRVFISHYNRQPLSESVVSSVFTFFALFGLTYAGIVVLLGLNNVDILTCLSAGAASLCNGGTGVGPIIGPSGHFSTLPEGAKWVLMVSMILGRLEMMTVFVLFSSTFWKK